MLMSMSKLIDMLCIPFCVTKRYVCMYVRICVWCVVVHIFNVYSLETATALNLEVYEVLLEVRYVFIIHHKFLRISFHFIYFLWTS